MDATRHRLLSIYLNDHLAGATAGVERARMTRDANEGTEFAGPLGVVCGEIEEDRSTLESIMDELGIGRSKVKPALGWLGEKLGRLKPNGQLRGYSPLGRVVDLEMLLLGISGKLRLWTLLSDLLDGETSADLPALIRRAEGQRSTVDDLQARAARLL
ncbi:MAG TPA: hypothetical protein VHZ54_06300 [Solirubrobacterales bacterium]|jgi:hypothetical protein|nr:hypothetical protein [Solirubrobacterales bacterium]